MTFYTDLTDRLGDGIESALRRAGDAQGSAIRRVRSRLGPRIPSLPETLSERLPQPARVARASFRLAERVLKAQEAYMLGLIDAASGRSPRRRNRRSTTATS